MSATATFSAGPGVLFRGADWVEPNAESRAGDAAALKAEREARDAAIRAASPDGMTALERALLEIERKARLSAVETHKHRARQFIHRPVLVNCIAWNLSQAEAHDGLAMVERLMRQQRARATVAIDPSMANLQAARIAFRWARRAERNGSMDRLLYGEVA